MIIKINILLLLVLLLLCMSCATHKVQMCLSKQTYVIVKNKSFTNMYTTTKDGCIIFYDLPKSSVIHVDTTDSDLP